MKTTLLSLALCTITCLAQQEQEVPLPRNILTTVWESVWDETATEPELPAIKVPDGLRAPVMLIPRNHFYAWQPTLF